MEYQVKGTSAIHTIVIKDVELTGTMFDEIRRTSFLDALTPESGYASTYGFRTASAAHKWLARFLRQHGWPTATTWHIYRSGSGWNCYEFKSAPSPSLTTA